MLTFKQFCKDFKDSKLSNDVRSVLEEYALEYGTENTAFCLFSDTLIIRVYDESFYAFAVICDLEEEHFLQATDAVMKYAVKEEIGLRFISVPSRLLGTLVSSFNYTESVTEDPERSSFCVRVLSEADRTEASFCLQEGDIALSLLCEEDIPDYARLCRDEEGLKYWGYDYREDASGESDEYFYGIQSAERDLGVSLSLSARHNGIFVGECLLYRFDYRGGAQIAFRLLPEYRGKGLGHELFEALLSAAEKLSLTSIYASVNKNNKTSVKILSKYMDEAGCEGDILNFVLSAEEQ